VLRQGVCVCGDRVSVDLAGGVYCWAGGWLEFVARRLTDGNVVVHS
jgi:hypothetical protein